MSAIRPLANQFNRLAGWLCGLTEVNIMHKAESVREQYDEIYNSIINGQREQAAVQMSELGFSGINNMLDYFADELNQSEIAIDAAKAYFRYLGA